MRRLMLLRHAKSEWPQGWPTAADRSPNAGVAPRR